MTPQVGYLLHFGRPFDHACHCMGGAVRLQQRLDDHRNGHGARFMFWVAQAGTSWQLAKTSSGGRQRQRPLKAQGGHSRHGPICRPPRRPERCQS